MHSHAQAPTRVEKTASEAVIYYDSVLAEDGSEYSIALAFVIREESGALKISYTVNNTSATRVNEVQFPFFELDRLSGDFKNDVLYFPHSYGQRIKDPHAFAMSGHREYMGSEYKNVWNSVVYPNPLSMAWF